MEQEQPGARPAAPRQRIELAVGGMTCSHCGEAVRRALGECEGVDAVEVNVPRGRAVVIGNELDPAPLTAAVTELGYTATATEQTV